MRTEGKVSKVAICERCNCYVMAGHIDYMDSKLSREYNTALKHGFTVKLETIPETQDREMGFYKECREGKCKTKTL